MCNLYRLGSSASEVAGLFRVADRTRGANKSEMIYPGYPGLVIANGELRSMSWGFPLPRKSKKTGKPLKPKPVNNARADKLDSYFWRSSFEHRRYLIPLQAFAEAQGTKGAMTRTWMTLPRADVFAVAGIWRESEEWGDCYSMVMTDATEQMAAIHTRMPVVLADAAAQHQWQHGTAEEAKHLCRPFDGRMAIDPTTEPWTRN